MTSRTFTPQQLDLIYGTVEHVAEHFYRKGQDDSKSGKSLNSEDFRLSKASRLRLKTDLIKALNKR